VENLTSHYVFALGSYRGFYLLNWIYRYCTEDDYQQRIVWLSGIVQTALYCDFFWYINMYQLYTYTYTYTHEHINIYIYIYI